MKKTGDTASGWPVWMIACGQLLGFCCQFFMFAGLVLFWMRDLGWAKSTLALGPMLAMLLGAALAPLVGKLVDRGKGPETLVAGAALGACALLALSHVETPTQWIAVWLVSGIAQLMSGYEISFGFLIRRLGQNARRAVIKLTLLGGFASTLGIPAYAALAATYGWRTAVCVGAAVMAFAVLPMNYFGTRAIRQRTMSPPEHQAPPPDTPTAPAVPAQVMRKRLILAAVFSLMWVNTWMIATYLVPIFVMQGNSEAFAVFVAALMGPVQVVGRLLLMGMESRISNQRAVGLCLIGMLVALLALAFSGVAPVLVIGYIVFQGATFGVLTILRPLLIADVLGREHYGSHAGFIQMITMTAGAVAPMLGALVLEGPGLGALIGLGAVFLVAGLGILRMLSPLR